LPSLVSCSSCQATSTIEAPILFPRIFARIFYPLGIYLELPVPVVPPVRKYTLAGGPTVLGSSWCLGSELIENGPACLILEQSRQIKDVQGNRQPYRIASAHGCRIQRLSSWPSCDLLEWDSPMVRWAAGPACTTSSTTSEWVEIEATTFKW
jgi:hypothetical protein